MSDTLLSIIIPIYNGERDICRIIDNIVNFNRGIFPFEIILIDDGSTDHSFKVCQRLIADYPEIKYIRKENGGIASARNVGLQNAVGEFITFSDQDDAMVAGYKKFVDRCVKDELDMLITSSYYRRSEDEKMNQRVFNDQTFNDKTQIKKIAGKLIDGDYFSDNTVPFVSTSVWNVIYRREALLNNNIRFKSFIDYEDDWIFNIETLLGSEKIAISSKGYYCWIIRNTSESHRNKYIPDLLSKRKNWMRWLSGIIDKLDVKPEKTERFFRDVLIPRNIMMCFNNACWNKEANKKEKLQEINDAVSPNGWNIKDVDLESVNKMSFSNRLLLRLLKANHTELAYFLNRNIIMNRFH